MALRFQSDSCTARKIQEASQYGHASFECARAPEDAPEARGGYECITSSNGQYPMTIKGCQECTSSCGVGKKKNGNGNGNKPDTSSSSSRGLSTPAAGRCMEDPSGHRSRRITPWSPSTSTESQR